MNSKRIYIVLCCIFFYVSLTAGAPQELDIEQLFDSGSISIGEDTIPFRLHTPPSASADAPKPLLIFLHGAGERGADNKRQLHHLPSRWFKEPHLGGRHEAFIFAPQCPRGEWWSAAKANEKGEWIMDIKQPVSNSLLAVEKKILELLQNPAIDKTRVYLTGLSMGGYGSWYLAHRHPYLFAGVVPICGGCDTSYAPKLAEAKLPIWVVHGDADNVIQVERSREIVHALRKEGGNITYTEIPNVGHNSWHIAYGPNGVIEWLFGQRNIDVTE